MPIVSSGFRGGGGDWTISSSQGFDPWRPKGSPLCTILRYPFWLTDFKIFLKAPWAPIYSKFWGRIFSKRPKNAFFGLFSKICLRGRKIGQIRVFIVVGGSSENQFGRPKKEVHITFKKILKIRPHLWEIPPAYSTFSFQKGQSFHILIEAKLLASGQSPGYCTYYCLRSME